MPTNGSLFVRLYENGCTLGRAFLLGLALVVASTQTAVAQEAATQVQQRLLESVKHLSADELQGRGVGTRGLDEAASYLAEQFRSIGLKTDLYDGTPFQNFEITIESKLGTAENNHLRFVGPDGDEIELKLGEEMTPLAIGGSAEFSAPLAFVGYGITARDENYDDYEGIDVNGKVVIILRHEPQQQNPHSVFAGDKDSQYAPIMRKVSNAYSHGAAAVLLVTDNVEIQNQITQARRRWQVAIKELAAAGDELEKLERPTVEQLDEQRKRIDNLADEVKMYGERMAAAYDPVFRFDQGGEGGDGRSMPVFHVRRAAVDKLLRAALDTDLAALETAIDKGPTPHSRILDRWEARGETEVLRQRAEVKNVIAVLEGQGPHADETIVIGAHYDHLGLGGVGSFLPHVREIHNGADDNASGTAVLVEVARQLAARDKPLSRRVVFIAFTGEERGLLGSSHYTREPLFPLEKTVAMLNMDMVGRLTDNKLVVYGTDTATEFEPAIDSLNAKYSFQLTKQPGGFGPSDHAAFYAKEVPVLHFFTGSHEDYHRPSDDWEKINVEGMHRIGNLVADMTVEIADAADRPTYQVSHSATAVTRGGDRPYFGSIPDFTQDGAGYSLTGVTKGSPADRGGLQAGDTILQLGDSKIGNLEDFDTALRKFKGGDRVTVLVRRDGKEVKLQVTLDPPR